MNEPNNNNNNNTVIFHFYDDITEEIDTSELKHKESIDMYKPIPSKQQYNIEPISNTPIFQRI
jgi:hypothetical protein